MKKLIAISIIFALVLGGAIAEIVFTTKVYDDIYDGLIEIRSSMEKHEDVLNPETQSLTEQTVDIWNKNKEWLFCFGNHNVLRTVDEKLVSLKAMVDINYTDDAKVMLKVCLSLVDAIRNDTVPNLTNMF